MIIKLIPETDAEKQRFQQQFGSDKIVHKNVKEYFFFGNKKGNDGLVDMHEWSGSYRYLMSSLKYFEEVINDERRDRGSDPQPKIQPLNVNQFLNKEVQTNDDNDTDTDEDETINVNAETHKGFIKHGTVDTQNVVPIDVEAIRKPHIVQMRPEDLKEIEKQLNQEADWIMNGDMDETKDNGEDNGEDKVNIPLPPPTLQFPKQ